MPRQLSRACSSCHQRKVRCDISQVGLPCTKCRKDGFECTAHVRKRSKDNARNIRSSGQKNHAQEKSNSSLDEHTMRHKFPWYAFIQRFKPEGQPWLHAKDSEGRFILPVPLSEQSYSISGRSESLSNEDMQYLESKGALDLPPPSVIEELVSKYFRFFHAFFPVIDREAFLIQFQQVGERNDTGPNLLLLQAVLFTAVPSISPVSLQAMGYPTIKQARSSLYDKVRHLYNFGYESDDILNIQSLLLISHYFPSMSNQKHTWFWAHQAITLAQGVGLHRYSKEAPQKKLWARIWWACFIRDRLIAFGTGRPMHINAVDCTTALPLLSELQETGDSEHGTAVKGIFLEFAKLCQQIEGILSLSKAGFEASRELFTRYWQILDDWKFHAQSTLAETGLQDPDDVGSRATFLYRGVLQLVHKALRIAVCQSIRTPDGSHDRSTPQPVMTTISQDSARLASELMQLEVGHIYPTICVTAILPSLVINLQNLRGLRQNIDDKDAKVLSQICLSFLETLGHVHWYASFYHRLFELAASSGSQLTATSGPSDKASATLLQGNGSVGVTDQQSQGNTAQRSLLTGGSTEVALSTSFESSILGDKSNAEDTGQTLESFSDSALNLFDLDEDDLGAWLNDYATLQSLFPSV